MKLFLKKALIFLFATSALYLALLTIISKQLGPVADQYYSKLLAQHTGSLILGDSRAGQGINPEILNDGNFLPFYNFAFTIGHSPWGNPYNHLIKKKFNGSEFSPSRIFILSVSPWTLQGHDENPFPESKLFTDNLLLDLRDPNFEYLIRFYENPLFDPIANINSLNYVDKNGRNTVKIDSLSRSDKKKHVERVNEYTTWLKSKGGISEHRLKALSELIVYLKNYGKVFLVRIPTDEVFENMENTNFPNFDEIIKQRFSATPYLNFFGTQEVKKFEYTDGCHLTKQSGNEFTKILVEKIESENKSMNSALSNR